MSIRTPRWVERRWHRRASLHFFRWGLHYKRRSGDRWRHLIVKATVGAALGQSRGRRQLWVGHWESRKGVRGRLGGFRLVVALDRLPPDPPDSIRVPFFPQRPRHRDRPFEIR